MRIASILACAIWVMPITFASADTTIDVSNKWAWSGSTGWINCRTDVTNGARIGEFFCSGYFWSSATGWINLGDGTPINGVQYTNADSSDFGVNHDGKGNLSGYAWSGSYGWIYFEHSYTSDWPRVNMTNGMFKGYVWNPSTGWISFDNLQGKLQTASIQYTDTDGDGLSDTWEIQYLGGTNSPLASGGSMWANGRTGYENYMWGTTDTNATAYGHSLTSQVPSAAPQTLEISWFAGSNRFYQVHATTNLTAAWQNASSNFYAPTAGVIRASVNMTQSNAFYRVKALLPPVN